MKDVNKTTKEERRLGRDTLAAKPAPVEDEEEKEDQCRSLDREEAKLRQQTIARARSLYERNDKVEVLPIRIIGVIADPGNVTALKEEEEWHEHNVDLAGRGRGGSSNSREETGQIKSSPQRLVDGDARPEETPTLAPDSSEKC